MSSQASTTSARVTCGLCGREAQGVYFQVGEQTACTRCKNQLEAGGGGTRIGRFSRATLFGLGAGLVGASLWYLVRWLTGYEIGLIAIVVGYLVGSAVKRGSRGRGGLRYQLLAVGLTYVSICANYVPDVIQGFFEKAQESQHASPSNPAEAAPPTPAVSTSAAEAPELSLVQKLLAVALFGALVLAIALAAPFLGGFESALGLLIIGFGLWEAWKLNAAHALEISGPFRIGSGSAPLAPASTGGGGEGA